MSTANAEAVISDKTLGAFEFLLTEPDHQSLLAEIAGRRFEPVFQTRIAIMELIETIKSIRRWYYPMTVRNSIQSIRYRQPLFEVWRPDNVAARYQDMQNAIHDLRPSPSDSKRSLPYQTWEALNATVHGMYGLAVHLFSLGANFFLPGKLCSDPIEEIMSALRYQAGSYEITASKAGVVLSKLENFQAVSCSPNVSTFAVKKKKRTELSHSPMKRSSIRGAPLRTSSFAYSGELAVLRSYGELLEVSPAKSVWRQLWEFDSNAWFGEEMVDVIRRPLGHAEIQADPLTHTDTIEGPLGDVSAAIAQRIKYKTACEKCKKLVVKFQRGSLLFGSRYIGARSRLDEGGLCLPRELLFALCMRAYGVFAAVHKIPAFWISARGHLGILLKCMLLKMDLENYHPLLGICSCVFSRELEYLCLRTMFNTLLNNAVKLLKDAAVDAKAGKRKATLMSDNSRKLKKLKQLAVQKSFE